MHTKKPVNQSVLTLLSHGQLLALALLESLQKLEFEVNNDKNVKVSFCQGDITKLNVDLIVNSLNKKH